VCIKPCNEPDSVNIADGMQILCGVAPLTSTEYDVILTSEVIEDLSQLPVASVCNVQVCVDEVNECEDKCDVNDVDVDDDEVSPRVRNVDDIMSSDCVRDTDELIEEQQADASLKQWWAMAKVNKGGFVVDQAVLYHFDKVEGQQVCQLCVPTSRRDSVMKLAHDSVFSGHLGERKTRERIRLSFFWPQLSLSVRQYVNTCAECQLRSRPVTLDRVPITPITRVDVPFQVLNMDCIGPIDPPSAQGHRYCLCIVENCTRWPVVYILKTLTARAVCDALLDLFANVGVPSKVTSDNGTNFSRQLTRELLKHIGCSPVFATPVHFHFHGGGLV